MNVLSNWAAIFRNTVDAFLEGSETDCICNRLT